MDAQISSNAQNAMDGKSLSIIQKIIGLNLVKQELSVKKEDHVLTITIQWKKDKSLFMSRQDCLDMCQEIDLLTINFLQVNNFCQRKFKLLKALLILYNKDRLTKTKTKTKTKAMT